MSRDEYIVSQFKYLGKAPKGIGPTGADLRDEEGIDTGFIWFPYQGLSSCDDEDDDDDPDWLIGYYDGMVFGFKWTNRSGKQEFYKSRWIRLPSRFALMMAVAAFPHWVPHEGGDSHE